MGFGNSGGRCCGRGGVALLLAGDSILFVNLRVRYI